eukprot:9137826-Pyramimonas_sp.AAC.2
MSLNFGNVQAHLDWERVTPRPFHNPGTPTWCAGYSHDFFWASSDDYLSFHGSKVKRKFLGLRTPRGISPCVPWIAAKHLKVNAFMENGKTAGLNNKPKQPDPHIPSIIVVASLNVRHVVSGGSLMGMEAGGLDGVPKYKFKTALQEHVTLNASHGCREIVGTSQIHGPSTGPSRVCAQESAGADDTQAGGWKQEQQAPAGRPGVELPNAGDAPISPYLRSTKQTHTQLSTHVDLALSSANNPLCRSALVSLNPRPRRD